MLILLDDEYEGMAQPVLENDINSLNCLKSASSN